VRACVYVCAYVFEQLLECKCVCVCARMSVHVMYDHCMYSHVCFSVCE
jgi:hypothetical protein